MKYSSIVIYGKPYQRFVEFDAVIGPNGMYFLSVHPVQVTSKCDHCGRFNLERKELQTVEELIENGWIIPVEEEV